MRRVRAFTQPSDQAIGRVKVALFAVALAPLAGLAWRAAHAGLGANPIEYITHSTGWWTLTLLLCTLTITPLRHATRWHWLLKLRRMLGLFAFFYAGLHFATYLWLDQFFDWAAILKDVLKRPFITLGFAAFLMMLPLAVTSNAFAMRLLGGRRWQRLHRAVYAVALLGVTHFWWLVKKDVREPLWFATILALLLAIRIWFWRRKTARSISPAIP